MSDLVRRIEAHIRRTPYRSGVEDLLPEAADEIERLERERDEARDAGRAQQSVIATHEEARRLAERERDEARAEVARLRAERDEVRARLDRADCTHREGGDTRHCRHDRLCWHCRHDEAVAEIERLRTDRDEWMASAAGYGTDAEQYKHERDEAHDLLRECRPWVVRGLSDHPAPTEDDLALLVRIDAMLGGRDE